MRSADFDVEVRIADGITHLFVRAAGVVEALRVRSLKLAGLCGGGQVGIENHKVIVLIAQLDKCLAIANARGDFLDVCH